MRRNPYDQRVLTLVQVCGGERDWAGAEQVFEQHGWPVLGHHPCGGGPLLGVLEPDPTSRVYEVEVRLPGSLHNCDRGAARRVAKALRRARLEAYVRRTEPLVRDREMFTEWQVFDAADHPRGRGARLGRRIHRLLTGLGRHDTGVRVTGTPREALRLARMTPPGEGAPVPARAAARPLDGRWRVSGRFWPEEEFERRRNQVLGWSLAAGTAAALASGGSGGSRPLWVVAAVLAGAAAMWSGSRLFRQGRVAGAAMAAVPVAMLALLGLGGFGAVGPHWTRQQALLSLVVAGVVAGLWLLVRQWSWSEWAAWVVPLAVSLAGSTFLAAGSVLHALYADGFSLDPGDLDVPPMWQVIAAVRLLAFLSLVLVLPAWWGFARHRHHAYAGTGDGFNAAVYVMLLVLILTGVASLAMRSAQRAVDRTIAAASRGEDPPPYFGVKPDWVCVELAVPAEQLSGEGPRLDPTRPYLSFGVAGETAVLWDRAAEEPVKLSAAQVRLIPAKAGGVCRSGG
ncbi:hypothetical protein [Kitasatospora sp. DSM 101779]|uniref:hypothetical protein n=1 Tax=Kitasatospora sp. DSM 101779 TaxID=2853165 RepID=UPI0021DB0BD2|nr:hypothetical protein [Kitasatospora sp. DSM 101779]MCU7822155.1 hypothetical protein [Kitasatospora sp. DSM 101779]